MGWFCFIAVLMFAFSSLLTNSFAINSPASRISPSLKLVVVVSRHGNRKALMSFKNDTFESSHWPLELGELTSYGKIQMFNLGGKIRSLYNGFLSSEYKSKYFYASSTASERSLMSGQTFLAGLFPPTGYQLWNRRILWQPVPIYSNSTDNTFIVSENCPRYLQDLSKVIAEYMIQSKDTISAIEDYIASQDISTAQRGSLLGVWDTLLSEDVEGLTLPSWSGKVYPQPMDDLVRELYIVAICGSDTMTKLVISQFFIEIIEIMKQKVNGTLSLDRRMLYYSGHDLTLIALQAVLGIPKSDIIGLVNPGSAMVYELHQDPTTSKHSVQVLYIDGRSSHLEPVSLQLPTCGQFCDFDQFVNITKRFCKFETFLEECKQK